jgi:hypothetical protein
VTRYTTTGRNSWLARTDGYQHSPRVPGPILSAIDDHRAAFGTRATVRDMLGTALALVAFIGLVWGVAVMFP